MNKPQNDDRKIEEQLADFTDKILEEDRASTGLDPELRELQKTVLRLKHALPPDAPSDEVIHRMRQNIVTQWRQEKEKTSESFWQRFLPMRKSTGQKWQSQQRRQRQSQRRFFAAAALLLLASVYLLNRVSSPQPAASGQSLNASIVIACSGLILLAVWVIRRKR